MHIKLKIDTSFPPQNHTKINMASLTKRKVGTTPAGSNPGEGLGPRYVNLDAYFFFLFQFFFSLEECQVSLFLWLYPSLSKHWPEQKTETTSFFFFLFSSSVNATRYITVSSEWLSHVTCLPHKRRQDRVARYCDKYPPQSYLFPSL